MPYSISSMFSGGLACAVGVGVGGWMGVGEGGDEAGGVSGCGWWV